MEEKIGKVILDTTCYPGKDLYSDGAIEDEMLAISRDFAPEEYNRMTACGLRKAVFPCEKALREKSAFFDKAIEIGVRVW